MNQNKHKYPECEKLASAHEESQVLGEFLEWLKRKYYICNFVEESDEVEEACFYPTHHSIEKLLAEYFNIDLDKVEEERRQILDEIRNKE